MNSDNSTTDAVHESPTNPRRSFSETSLEELTASVRRHGVLQPILVRPNGDGFILIAGARRLRAARLADCATIPARVLDLDDAAADEATIIENLHREDIHPLDEGESYQRLVASGRTIEDVAVAIGKSKGYVYQRISLTRLVPKVQDLLARDVLPLDLRPEDCGRTRGTTRGGVGPVLPPTVPRRGGAARSARAARPTHRVGREDGPTESSKRGCQRAPADAGGASRLC